MPRRPEDGAGLLERLASRLLEKYGPAWLLLAVLLAAGMLGARATMNRMFLHLDRLDAFMEQHNRFEAEQISALQLLSRDITRYCQR